MEPVSVFSRRGETLRPSGDVGKGEMAGRGRSKRGLADQGGASLRGVRLAGWRVSGGRAAAARRQAGSGIARSRARARVNWVSQGQRWGRCRVRRRAERVSRPAREKKRRRRVLVVAVCSPRPMRAVQGGGILGHGAEQKGAILYQI